MINERNFHGHGNNGAGDAPRLRVIGERRGLRGNYGAFQHGVGGLPRIIGDLVMRARQKFADNVAREHLLNAVGLRLVHKDWHGDGAHAGRDARGVSGGVIAAARHCEGECRQQNNMARERH